MSDTKLEPKRSQSHATETCLDCEPSERDRPLFEQLKQIAHQGKVVFYRTALALRTIRDRRLYRLDGYTSFEAFTRSEFDLSRPQAYRLIDAAITIEDLMPSKMSPTGDILPETPLPNERQARELSGLEPEEKRSTWTEALDTAPQGRVTAKHVARVRGVRAARKSKRKSPTKPPPPAAQAGEEAPVWAPYEKSELTIICRVAFDQIRKKAPEATVRKIESVFVEITRAEALVEAKMKRANQL
jgi:hypothetical protein